MRVKLLYHLGKSELAIPTKIFIASGVSRAIVHCPESPIILTNDVYYGDDNDVYDNYFDCYECGEYGDCGFLFQWPS